MLRRAFVALPFVLVLVTASGASPAGQTAGTASQTPPVASGKPAFFIRGHGWGHGVGMSQYGALGFAQRGVGYARIVAHYYRGTTLGRAPVAKVRVLLRDGAKSVALGSKAAFRVRAADGRLFRVPAGRQTIGPGLKVKTEGKDVAEALPGPLLFTGTSAPLELGKPYRGQFQLIARNNRLQVVNHVGLEAYLYGVVPREVPFDWLPEALKAQAVVARSYALAVRKIGGTYDLFDDTRSQVYGGIEAEKPSSTAAVDATAGQVLTYAGRVATTYFFSTSGGRTASIADVWPGSPPVPYLVSVPDPYDSISPHHSWGPYPFSAARLAKAFKVPGALLDVLTTVNRSARVDSVTAIGTRGRVSVTGPDVREILGLRSTWFRVGVLALDRPVGPAAYAAQTKLTGRARSLGKVTLEQQASPGVWEPAARIGPKRDGTFEASVKLTSPTVFRLSAGRGLVSGAVRVAVAPRVRIAPVEIRTQLSGLVRPVLPGVTVTVQRETETGWRAVASGKLDAAGRFVVKLELLPGVYRARVAPGRGFAPGVSPVLRVLGE
jgi:stage II sporulation protein D